MDHNGAFAELVRTFLVREEKIDDEDKDPDGEFFYHVLSCLQDKILCCNVNNTKHAMRKSAHFLPSTFGSLQLNNVNQNY